MAASTIQLSVKCSDMFAALTDDGRCYEGYVPKLFSGELGEDYIDITIDIATGKIDGWKQPSEADIDELFGEVHG
jgi:hypothetical protein